MPPGKTFRSIFVLQNGVYGAYFLTKFVYDSTQHDEFNSTPEPQIINLLVLGTVNAIIVLGPKRLIGFSLL